MIVVLLPAGVAWIAVIAGMNSATQSFLPTWVRARALSIYQVVIFTSFAASAAVWGAVARWIGLGDTFMVAGGLLIIGAATVPRWPLLNPAVGDREASTYWIRPDVTLTADVADDPVMVSIRYTVPASRQDDFLTAMAALRTSRLRTGATSWALYRDALDDSVFIEQYAMTSWQDHERQHDQRLTEFDHKVQLDANQLADRVEDAQHLLQISHRDRKATRK